LLLSLSGTASAARAIFHYAGPADGRGAMSLKPSGPCGTIGEYISFYGREPCNRPPRPTCVVTYRHPCSGRSVSVPLAFPLSTPRIEYRTDRVIYNYGSYTIEVHFLADGSVDVVYDSGLFRAL
jgi:hypothetical protein